MRRRSFLGALAAVPSALTALFTRRASAVITAPPDELSDEMRQFIRIVNQEAQRRRRVMFKGETRRRSATWIDVPEGIRLSATRRDS